jgi:hypothetical protein
MKQIFQFIADNLTMIVVIASFVLPALGRALKTMKQQQHAREAAAKARRAEYDKLRTGQSVEPVLAAPKEQPTQVFFPKQATTQERAAQIAARRKAELEAMRAQSASQTKKSGTRVVRLPGGIVLELPDENQLPGQRTPAPASSQSADRPLQHAKPQRAAAREERKQRRAPAQAPQMPQQAATAFPGAAMAPKAPSNVMEDVYGAVGTVARGPTSASPRARAVVFRKGMTRDEVRRAIVMNELLGRPMSERA